MEGELKDLWVPISGAIAQQRNVETIANNVANANTPGFKKDQMIFKEYLTALEKGSDIDLPNKEWAPEDFYRTYGAEHAFVKAGTSYTNHNQGQLTPTHNPLDLGLNGPGFIEVLTPNGVRYTRRGTLTLNNEGKLVTDQGFFVLNKINLPATNEQSELKQIIGQLPSPKERVISLNSGNITINSQGEVFQNSSKLGDISIVEFNDSTQLSKEGNSLFVNPSAENILKTNPKTVVLQGFIEQSNVNAVEEMSNLIKAHRQFESIQKVIKTYDSISGKAVNEIAKF